MKIELFSMEMNDHFFFRGNISGIMDQIKSNIHGYIQDFETSIELSKLPEKIRKRGRIVCQEILEKVPIKPTPGNGNMAWRRKTVGGCFIIESQSKADIKRYEDAIKLREIREEHGEMLDKLSSDGPRHGYHSDLGRMLRKLLKEKQL